MTAEFFYGFASGAFIAAVVSLVFMGTVAHNNWERYRTMKAVAFKMEEQLLDCLEGNVERKWEMVDNGLADPTVERVPQIGTSKLSEGTRVIKIGDMDDA